MQSWGVNAVAVAAIVVMLVSFAVVDSRMLPAAPGVRSLLLSLASAAPGVLAWVVFAPVVAPARLGELFLPIAALGGVATFIATVVVRASGAGPALTLVFGFAWGALVFVPTAILSFASSSLKTPFQLLPVDHGGSLAFNVAAGAAALGVLLANGNRARRLRAAAIGPRAGAVAVVALCAGWIAWLASAELALDDVTPGIVLNGIIGAFGGVAGWLVVQRIRHQSTTLNAVAAGLITGLVSITAGAPLFTPLSAAAAGILAGAAACIFTLRRVGSSRRQQWFIVGTHLVAGTMGIVLFGLLATGMGFLFTGDSGVIWRGRFSLVESQLVSALLVAAYSTTVSFALWSALRRFVVTAQLPSSRHRDLAQSQQSRGARVG